MACYNAARFFAEAIESVLAQTVGDLELIVIDDGSTDATREIARRYSRRDDRVRIIASPGRFGPGAARNLGIAVARGEWLFILDSDDVALPDRIEAQLETARRDDSLVLLSGDAILIDAAGREIGHRHYPLRHAELLARLRWGGAFPSHSSMAYRREAVARLGGFNARYPIAEDFDLWQRLSEVGKMLGLDRYVVRRRHHGNSITSSEGQHRSIVYGYSACVCQRLRQRGAWDPSVMGSDEEWAAFLDWMARKLGDLDVFRLHRISEETALHCRMRDAGRSASLAAFADAVMRGGAWAWLRRWQQRRTLPTELARRFCEDHEAGMRSV